jgi:hypothetical protein
MENTNIINISTQTENDDNKPKEKLMLKHKDALSNHESLNNLD